MKIACWNVNSVKSRREHLIQWIDDNQPDVVMLQELKCIADDFPALELSGLGYHAQLVGQKTYNGVAILTRNIAKLVCAALPGDQSDEQARFIDIELDGWRLINVYVPNGQAVGSDKFDYKMRFYKRLYDYLSAAMATEEKIIVGGDFNVAMQDIDTFDPRVTSGDILFSDPERAELHKIWNLGFTDCYRALNPTAQKFSWWDYRGGGYERNLGFRIDYLFASPRAAGRLQKSWMDETTRGLEKPSDHIPVVAEFI